MSGVNLFPTAYQQNLPLQIAGLRILDPHAQLSIAVGNRYPQLQQASGSISAVELSENSPNFIPPVDNEFPNYQSGFDAALANLSATVADYDNALVSLTAEVAISPFAPWRNELHWCKRISPLGACFQVNIN